MLMDFILNFLTYKLTVYKLMEKEISNGRLNQQNINFSLLRIMSVHTQSNTIFIFINLKICIKMKITRKLN